MGRAIVVGAVILLVAIVIVFTLIYLVRHGDKVKDKRAGLPVHGDLSARQEKAIVSENNEAASLIRRLLMPSHELDVSTIVVLPDKQRTDLERWLHDHDARKGK